MTLQLGPRVGLTRSAYGFTSQRAEDLEERLLSTVGDHRDARGLHAHVTLGSRGTPRTEADRARELQIRVTELQRLVFGVMTLGITSIAVLAATMRADGFATSLWTGASGTQHALLVGAFVVAACVAELFHVALRHGDSTEGLTFFEAVLISGLLVLPPAMTFTVCLGGVLLPCLMMREPLNKTLFNLGSYSTATAALVGTTFLLADLSDPFAPTSVLALFLGAAVFTAINLVLLAYVLAVTEHVNFWQILAQQWRLSAFMAVSHVGLGTITVAVMLEAPVLLPFMALPVIAIRYAYRAVARHADEVERGRSLVEIGGLLISGRDREDPTQAVTGVLQRIFGCDIVLCVTVDAGFFRDGEHLAPLSTDDADGMRAGLSGVGPPRVLGDGELLPDWRYGMVAALEPGSSDNGLMIIGWKKREGSSRRRPPVKGTEETSTLGLLGAVATACGSSARSQRHLNDLLEESTKLTSVVEHSSDGIVVLNRQGELLVWNPAMERLVGARPERLSSLSLDGVDAVAALVAQLATRSGAVLELDQLVRALAPGLEQAEADVVFGADEDTVRELKISVARTRDGDDWRLAILTVHDMTQERRLDRLKSDFIATVSHELRTPITPIKGYARLLAIKGDELDAGRRLKALELIEERADHLARLVEDLLLTSRVSTAGTARFVVEPTRQELGELVARAVDSFPHLSDRLVLRRPSIALPIEADAMRVVQCLSNLIGNAEKYSPAGSPITVEAVAPGTDGVCRVDVVDRGRGIATPDLEHIFRRFHRIENPLTMRTSGSGLGLFIARELARAMDGDITAQSVIGEGSSFTLELPLAQPLRRGPALWDWTEPSFAGDLAQQPESVHPKHISRPAEMPSLWSA